MLSPSSALWAPKRFTTSTASIFTVLHRPFVYSRTELVRRHAEVHKLLDGVVKRAQQLRPARAVRPVGLPGKAALARDGDDVALVLQLTVGSL